MTGLLGKLKTAIVGSAHDFVDNHENVGVTARQTVRDLEEQIGQAEDALATTMAEHNVRINHRDAAQMDVKKYGDYAEKAVAAGNDDLARQALQDQEAAQTKLNKLQGDVDKFQPLIDKQRAGVQALKDQLQTLQERVSDLETRSTIAEAENRTATILGGIGSGESSAKVFDRLEDKVTHQEGLAEAKTTLAGEKMHSPDDKYAALNNATAVSSIDDKLAAMKAAHAASATPAA